MQPKVVSHVLNLDNAVRSMSLVNAGMTAFKSRTHGYVFFDGRLHGTLVILASSLPESDDSLFISNSIASLA